MTELGAAPVPVSEKYAAEGEAVEARKDTEPGEPPESLEMTPEEERLLKVRKVHLFPAEAHLIRGYFLPSLFSGLRDASIGQ
jgi:hypothetical protein